MRHCLWQKYITLSFQGLSRMSIYFLNYMLSMMYVSCEKEKDSNFSFLQYRDFIVSFVVSSIEPSEIAQQKFH